MTPNPGHVKTIIDVKLPEERIRTSPEFWAVRDQVFAAFDCLPKVITEYQI